MGEVVRIVRQQFLNQERAPEPDLGEEGVAASTEELLKDYQAFLQAPQTYSVPCELHLVRTSAMPLSIFAFWAGLLGFPRNSFTEILVGMLLETFDVFRSVLSVHILGFQHYLK